MQHGDVYGGVNMATRARRAMVALALLVFGAALVGCTASGGNTARTIEPLDPLGPPPVALVAGTIFDEVTGVGIRGAVVNLGGEERATDRYGCFSFGQVDLPQQFTITFSAEFYETVSSTVDRTTTSGLGGREYWFAVGLVRGTSTMDASTSVVCLRRFW